MSRVCTRCREPFTAARPPAEPVRLGEFAPGSTVPRLRIVAEGALCAACARAELAPRKRRRLPGCEALDLLTGDHEEPQR